MTKPESAIKHQRFQDLMARHHGQMESALYAAEQICASTNDARDSDCTGCPWKNEKYYASIPPEHDTHPCKLMVIRVLTGYHVEQHDIIISADTTQAERKANR